MANAEVMPVGTRRLLGSDVLFALGIVTIVTILILPIPPILIDLGLAVSIALSAAQLISALLSYKRFLNLIQSISRTSS